MNMTSTNPEDYQKVVDGLKGKDVAILVNNAMQGTTDGLVSLSLDQIHSTMNSCMYPSLFVTYYLIPKLLERGQIGAVICHGGRDLGFQDFFARTMAMEFAGKIDFMSVIDTEEQDPEIAAKALANLGSFKQTFADPMAEIRQWTKADNLIKLFK
jgi:hypothetical protein